MEFTYPTPLDCNPNQVVPAEITLLDYDPSLLDCDPTLLDYDPNHLVPMEMACPCPTTLDHDPNQLVPLEITYPSSLPYNPNLEKPILHLPLNVHVPVHTLETIKLFLMSGLISDRKTIKNLLTLPLDVA